MRIRVLKILEQTTADGPGFRTSVYCAGCRHACKGCHNPESWDFNAGEWMVARRIKQETDKTIWCWPGFTLEEIEADPHLAQMLPWLDVLVDGPFVLALRDTELLFRGSPNQRIIYLHEKPEDDIIPGTVPLVPFK